MFFETCNRCKMTFTDEAQYLKHKNSHISEQKAVDEKPIENIRKQNAFAVPGDMNEDKRLKDVQEINEKRKKLIHAGIEAATMKPDEVNARYAAEFGNKGKQR